MVIILLGSKADLNTSVEIISILEKFGISYRLHIGSAHKTPEHVLKIISKNDSQNNRVVYICIAGRSNALGGFVDANTSNPVINCPPYSEKFAGLDILSSLRMPSGVGVLTVLEPEQAALSAAKILSLSDNGLKTKVEKYQKIMKEKIIRDDAELK